jgi:ABC-type amino acid transport substrate-binding protein
MFRKFTVFGLAVLLSLGIFSAAFGAPRSLEEIKESGVLRVGVEDETWGVFHIWEGDQLSGFEIDLCNAIAAALGVSAEYAAVPWGEGEEGTITGALEKGVWKEWDMLAGGVTITKERQEFVAFAEWMFNAGQVLIVRKDSGIKDLEDAAGKKFGAQQNTSSMETIDTRLKGAESVPFEMVQQAFEALMDGSVQGVVIDAPLAFQEAKAHPDLLEVLERPLTRERLSLVLPKDVDPKLLEIINAVIEKERKDLYKKWF